jgi:hypothetical protein
MKITGASEQEPTSMAAGLPVLLLAARQQGETRTFHLSQSCSSSNKSVPDYLSTTNLMDDSKPEVPVAG